MYHCIPAGTLTPEASASLPLENIELLDIDLEILPITLETIETSGWSWNGSIWKSSRIDDLEIDLPNVPIILENFEPAGFSSGNSFSTVVFSIWIFSTNSWFLVIAGSLIFAMILSFFDFFESHSGCSFNVWRYAFQTRFLLNGYFRLLLKL